MLNIIQCMVGGRVSIDNILSMVFLTGPAKLSNIITVAYTPNQMRGHR